MHSRALVGRNTIIPASLFGDFASSALKQIYFSILLANGSPVKLIVIYIFITNIPIIVANNSGGVVSIPLTSEGLPKCTPEYLPKQFMCLTFCGPFYNGLSLCIVPQQVSIIGDFMRIGMLDNIVTRWGELTS